MLPIYLWFNAVLYAGFALWCTFAVTKTAAAIGYVGLNNGGRAEYMTVYGGLQLGLALFFAYCAYTPRLQGVGVVFGLCLYVPIVLWRMIGLAQNWPVGNNTLMVAGLEVFMLAWSVWAWYSQR